MSATFSSENTRSPIYQQISEIQRKIQLLEEERRAHSESSQGLIKKNKEQILQLRHENKLLHRKLAEALTADKQVIRDAFQSHNSAHAYRNMSGKAAVQALDQKVSDKMKKLNALKHMTNTQRHRLEDLNTDYNTVKATKPGLLNDGVATNEVDFADEQPQKNLCVLENQLGKAQLKCQEAEHIIRSYQTIKEHLQEEGLTFQSQLDKLECEIVQKKQELRDLQLMYTKTYQEKCAAKTELQYQESMVCAQRRERALILNRYKKQGERRAQRDAQHTGEFSSEAQCSESAEEENNKTISSIREAFKRITEATGVTDTQEVVDRFVSQRDTHTYMEKLKVQKERELQLLKEERDAVNTEYEDLKYSGDAKLTHRRRLVEECESQLQREQQEHDTAKETVDRLTHRLNAVSKSVEHMCHKLNHITQQEVPGQQECVSSLPELNLLWEVELKMMQLQEELQGHDIDAVIKEMKEQEGKLPDLSTSITQLDYQTADLHEIEDDSEDEDGELLTRMYLKQQSQGIIDTMSKMKSKLPQI